MSSLEQEGSILDKLDAAVPAPLAQFDAFPKLPSTYKTRSESRGFLTIFVVAFCVLLTLNDVGEYIWGWPDHEFNVDREGTSSFMNVNVDLIVNMPCRYLSVDVRDALGDRIYLSSGLRREGTFFDVGQATALKTRSTALSASQVVAQSRSSRGFFSTISRWTPDILYPRYRYRPHGRGCRISGSMEVKKVTANLHITTAGHGYASSEHTEHSEMNLSHVITEFSFGPYFPDITQPLDYSFEVTQDPFVAYQYFIHVVPTTYIAPRSAPLHTNQYSVTHYTRKFEHGQAIPGIFFKFDLEPLSLTIHQRTISLVQLLIRCVGVIGGVFVCTGYAIRVTNRAVEVVSGADKDAGLVAAKSTGAKASLRQKWGGGSIRARNSGGRMVRQGNGWVLERPTSPFGSFAENQGSPALFSPPIQSPYLNPPGSGLAPPTPQLGTPSIGLGFPSSSMGPVPGPRRSPVMSSARLPSASSTTAMIGSPSLPYSPPAPSLPGTPAYAQFPPTPNIANGGGFPQPHAPSSRNVSPHRNVSGARTDR